MAGIESLIALKLHAGRLKDQADIVELLKVHQVDMKDWPLTQAQINKFAELQHIAAEEKACI